MELLIVLLLGLLVLMLGTGLGLFVAALCVVAMVVWIAVLAAVALDAMFAGSKAAIEKWRGAWAAGKTS